MADWNRTIILHDPRKFLGLTVLEYTVLDVIYKSQISPVYSVDGWAKNGCHQLAKFMGCSPATVLAIFARMEVLGYIELNESDKQLKKTTEAFYSVAYEKDRDNLSSKQGCSKTERVRKLNASRSETERKGVRKLNGRCSETEHKYNLKESSLNELKEKEVVETSSTVVLIDEVDKTTLEIHHVPDYFEDKEGIPYFPQFGDLPPLEDLIAKATQKKERKGVAAEKKESPDAAPVRAMWEMYVEVFKQFSDNTPTQQAKHFTSLSLICKELRKKAAEKNATQSDLELWRKFLDEAKKVAQRPNERWLHDNFTPSVIWSQFDSILIKIKTKTGIVPLYREPQEQPVAKTYLF